MKPSFTSAAPMGSCKQRILRIAVATILPWLLSSCQDERPAEVAKAQGIFIAGNTSEPKGIDPQIATGVLESNIISSLFEGLACESPDTNGEALPGAAASWDANEDFTEWTFHLQPEGRWSDGRPVTADDFVFSYHRLLHPDFGGKYSSILFPIRNAEAFNKGEITDFDQVGVKALDDHTLRIDLRGPVPYLPEITKHYTWFPVPRHVVLARGKMTDPFSDWTDPGNIVSNGPFQLAEWEFNRHILVVANPYYWDAENVGLKGIRFLPISNPYTEARMFFAGQIHATFGLAPEMIEYARERAPEALRQEPYLGTMFMRINVERNGLRDPRIRKALSLSIDRQSIIDNILKGGQVPATGVVPPFQGYAPYEAELLNLGRAKQLLAEAGYPGGKGLPQIKILTTDKDTSKAMGEAIQAMWSAIGINVGIEQMEWTTYLETMQRGNYDVGIGGWIGDFLDPTTFLEMWQTGDGNNNTNWGNPEYDRLLKKAQQVKDPAERIEVLRRAEALFMGDQAIVPMYWYTINYLMDPSVEGWEPLLLNNHPYKYVHFAK